MTESHYYDNDTFTPNLKDISGNTSIIYLYDPSYTPLALSTEDFYTNTDPSYVQFNNQIFSISDEIVTRGIGKITDASITTFVPELNADISFNWNILGVPFIGNYSEQGGIFGTDDATMTRVFDLFEYKQNGYTISPIHSGTTFYGAQAHFENEGEYIIYGNPSTTIVYTGTNKVTITQKGDIYGNGGYEVITTTDLDYNAPSKYYEFSRIHSYDYPQTLTSPTLGNVNLILTDRGSEHKNPKQITDEITINTLIITTFTYTVGSFTTTQDTILSTTSYTANINTLQTIEIGKTVTSIAADAFKLSTNLTSITFEQVSTLTTIGNSAFHSSGVTGTLIVPTSLTTIEANAFQSCANLTTIDFELDSMIDNGGAGTIGSNAFDGCTSLTTFNAYQSTIDANSWSTSPQTIGGKSNIIITNLSDHILYTYSDNTTSSHGDTTLSSSNNNNILTTVAIGSQVTSMANDTFKDSSTLTSMTFDSDIQLPTISTNAFKNSGLTGAITLPGSLIGIGSSAFQLCANITSVNFNLLGQLATIGVSAFEGCSSLNGTFPLPDSLTSLGASSFKSCSNMTTVSFSSNLTTISDSTFQSSGLTGVITLPTTLTSIGSSAFQSCSNMTSVNFNELAQLTAIGVSTFEGCSSLTGGITLPASLTTIEENAFNSCTSITSITFESSSLTSGGSISNNAFTGCTSLTTINANQNTIDAMSWTPGASQSFYGITVTINNLSVVTEPTRFTLVDNSIITSSETIITASSYSDNTNIKQVTIGESVASIASQAFLGKTNLETLFFNVNNISFITISSEAFKSSGLVGAVSLPTTLTTIGSSAFHSCTNMSSVNFNELNLITTITNSAFHSSGLNGDITLPSSLMTIEDNAFHSCSTITSITFGSGSLTSGGSISNTAFDGCTSLTTINAHQNTIDAMGWTTSPQTIGGISVDIINLSTTVFTYTDNSTSTTEDTILTYKSYDDVNKILLKINIGPSVIQIGDSAGTQLPFFSETIKMDSLISLTFSPNSTLKVIETQSFYPCGNLGGDLTIPASVETIGNGAFRGCGNINLSFESGSVLSKIEKDTFYKTGLSGTITIPASVTHLNQQCFFDSKGDYDITFEAGSLLTAIANYAFYDLDGNNGLRHITLPSSLKTIGDLAFQDCDLMSFITFEQGSLTGDGVSIGLGIFNKCNNLTTIYAHNDTIEAMGWTNPNPQDIGGIDVTVESLS
jgi:hypothetical protein